MTIRGALREGISRLWRASDHRDSAALDAELILACVLGVEREKLYSHPDDVVAGRSLAAYRRLIDRRNRHEPLAYIIGEKEFFGLRLAVNHSVLIPRPETESLVELVTEHTGRKKFRIIDVGTGSGAIAIALAKHIPNARIIATDTSSKALAVARANARRHGLSRRIRFIRSDLLPKLPTIHYSLPTIVVANLPYLPTRVWKQTAPEIHRYEPRAALNGGHDGLDLYRKLLNHMTRIRWSAAFFEIDPHQRRSLTRLVIAAFPAAATTTFFPDLSGRTRFARILTNDRSF